MSQVLIDLFRAAAAADGVDALLEGLHPLKHALRFDAAVHRAVSPDPTVPLALAARLAPDLVARMGVLIEAVPTSLFRQLAPAPPASGVLAVARRPKADLATLLVSRAAPVVLLHEPKHLGNLGAAVRAAAAAGAAAVLSAGPGDPWHPAALRGSAGLHFALPVLRATELPAGVGPLVACDPEGEPLRPGLLPDRAVLLFGSERSGLGPEWLARADARVSIPMRPGVSSLNLATAVAVALYAWRLSRR